MFPLVIAIAPFAVDVTFCRNVAVVSPLSDRRNSITPPIRERLPVCSAVKYALHDTRSRIACTHSVLETTFCLQPLLKRLLWQPYLRRTPPSFVKAPWRQHALAVKSAMLYKGRHTTNFSGLVVLRRMVKGRIWNELTVTDERGTKNAVICLLTFVVMVAL